MRGGSVRLPATLVVCAAVFGCAPVAFAGPDCRPVGPAVQLDSELVESSGAAVSRRDPGVIWTHNDDGSRLYAIDRSGGIKASYRVRPRLRDWEDLAVGPCDVHGFCLYAADTGDNAEVRRAGDIRLVRLPEVAASGAGGDVVGDVFPMRLPDGARDIEALIVLDERRIYFVTKGRGHSVSVYRYPPPLRPDTVTLVEVQQLTTGRVPLGDQLTGASSDPDGAFVALRTYQALEFYRFQSDTLARIDDGRVNLRTLREPQGEGVALGPDGLVVLTSEGGIFGGEPVMHLMRCSLEPAP